MIIINFKNYKIGKEALKLAGLIEKYIPGAIVCVSELDVSEIAKNTKLKVFVQHLDYFKTTKATGFLIAENVKSAGAEGSLLNHSEHRLSDETISKTIKRAKENGLKIILCADNLKNLKKYKVLKPYAIAFEEPSLIASGKSITQYKTKEIERFVKIMKNSGILPLCGAGIHSKYDALMAKELGCKGVLISSAIANVSLKEAENLLRELSNI